MAEPLSVDAFYESAQGFAQTALDAHHRRDYRRAALDAGTALEHLLKACLTRRSPALIVELRKGEGGFGSLLRLLGIREGEPVKELRTVSLRDAVTRVKGLVPSTASYDDLGELADMRDGTVHAALDDEVEERLVAAFVQHANALLADLGHTAAEFWGVQLAVVDALLDHATASVAHRVRVRIAAALASFERRYGEEPPELLRLLRQVEPEGSGSGEVPADCPACRSVGLATGYHDVEWEPDWDGGDIVGVGGTVWFVADGFACGRCGLRLTSAAELEAAGLDWRWEVEGADPREYEPPVDEDSLYEAWLDARSGHEDWGPGNE